MSQKRNYHLAHLSIPFLMETDIFSHEDRGSGEGREMAGMLSSAYGADWYWPWIWWRRGHLQIKRRRKIVIGLWLTSHNNLPRLDSGADIGEMLSIVIVNIACKWLIWDGIRPVWSPITTWRKMKKDHQRLHSETFLKRTKTKKGIVKICLSEFQQSKATRNETGKQRTV